MTSFAEAEIARLQEKVGTRVSVSALPYLTEVTTDAVRHWAWATGDRNPLYLDESFARSSRYGGLIGPPAMLYAFSRLAVGYRGGLAGFHSVFGGSHWTWRRPLKLGTKVSTDTKVTGLTELPSRFAGKMLKQTSTTYFFDAEQQEIAQVESWGLRFTRDAQTRRRDAGKDDSAPKEKTGDGETSRRPSFSKESIDQIAQTYRREVSDLAQTRNWASVEVGQELPEIIRGPYSSSTAVAFEQAWGGTYVWAHGYWFDLVSRHPGAGIVNEYGFPEPAECVHWDSSVARKVGVRDTYDIGPERIAWIATLLTNWIGTTAFLSELYCEVRSFNFKGNVTHCRGRVASMDRTENADSIRVEVQAIDDEGRVTAQGWGKVIVGDVPLA